MKSHFYMMECVGPGFQRRYPVQSIEQCPGGRLYAFNPIAVPVLAMPFVALIEPAMHLMRHNPRRLFCFAVGFILALALFVRPTNAVTVLVVCGYLVVRVRSKAGWLLGGGFIPTVAFVRMNFAMYGSLLAPLFLPVHTNSTGLALHSQVGLALISNLFSPARGPSGVA